MKNSRILIAENHELSHLVASALASYQVVTVTSVAEAIHSIAEDNFDLIIVSVHFDDSRSLELVSHIRSAESSRKTPIILLRIQPVLLGELLRQTANTLIKTNLISKYIECEQNSEMSATLNVCVETCLPSRLH